MAQSDGIGTLPFKIAMLLPYYGAITGDPYSFTNPQCTVLLVSVQKWNLQLSVLLSINSFSFKCQLCKLTSQYRSKDCKKGHPCIWSLTLPSRYLERC